jgi:predicted ATP-grasp superfamily ATP-dependent carboligase
MHDQLRDMGRQIVREVSIYECHKQSRIWDKEETRMVLFNEKVFISSSNVHQSLSCLPWWLNQHYVKCCVYVSKSMCIHGNAYKLGMCSLN